MQDNHHHKHAHTSKPANSCAHQVLAGWDTGKEAPTLIDCLYVGSGWTENCYGQQTEYCA